MRTTIHVEDPDARFQQEYALELSYSWCRGSPRTHWEPGEAAHPEDLRFVALWLVIDGVKFVAADGQGEAYKTFLAKWNKRLDDDPEFFCEAVEACCDAEHEADMAAREAKAEAAFERLRDSA